MLKPTYAYYYAMFRKHGLTPLSEDQWSRAVARPIKAGQGRYIARSIAERQSVSDTAQDIETERREGWTYGER